MYRFFYWCSLFRSVCGGVMDQLRGPPRRDPGSDGASHHPLPCFRWGGTGYPFLPDIRPCIISGLIVYNSISDWLTVWPDMKFSVRLWPIRYLAQLFFKDTIMMLISDNLWSWTNQKLNIFIWTGLSIMFWVVKLYHISRKYLYICIMKNRLY